MTEDTEMKGSYSRGGHELNRSWKVQGERFKSC